MLSHLSEKEEIDQHSSVLSGQSVQRKKGQSVQRKINISKFNEHFWAINNPQR